MSKVKEIVAYFLPKKNEVGNSSLKDERIFVSVILISALFNLLGFLNSLSMQMYFLGIIVFANSLFSILLLFLYRQGVSKNWVGNIFLLQFEASFALQAWLQGGLKSPATTAFILLPAIAMLILGKKDAIIWIILTCITIFILYIIEKILGSPHMYYPDIEINNFYFSSYLAINLAIFCILLVYENAKNNSINELAKQHNDLKIAQRQLIQSEKMASLGELTAGIAHEIQNPLNFVKNFSEVSVELMDELIGQMDSGNLGEARLLIQDIKQNLGKIGYHESRADAIVKGMLVHSRASNQAKILTDVNLLLDEYLRLSFHGFHAKDKAFNATYSTDFDNSLAQIRISPQDIGRVALNIFNNAFYAVHKKAVESSDSNYEPIVSVQTLQTENNIEIRVTDNGNGIKPEIINKIFQPFFTTKPTGEGTGLGLSISYEIIKNMHQGDLVVESVPGKFTTLTIILPKV